VHHGNRQNKGLKTDKGIYQFVTAASQLNDVITVDVRLCTQSAVVLYRNIDKGNRFHQVVRDPAFNGIELGKGVCS
jgi:hypothetical protein